jgi:flagellar basal-body rod modification protein FlgD
MASGINPLTGTSANTASSSGANSLSAPNEQMFLQLLVAQLQNQDPMNPADSTQFVSQLAQFSQLEQLIAIRSDIENGASLGANGTNSNTGSSGQPDNSSTQGTTPNS